MIHAETANRSFNCALRGVLLLVVMLAASTTSFVAAQTYVEDEPESGEGIYGMLRRYNLPATGEWVALFSEINNLDENATLIQGRTYRLPLQRHVYNGRSIRSTLNIADFDEAQRIADYNNSLTEKGIRSDRFVVSKDLWVPVRDPGEISSTTDEVSGPTASVASRSDRQISNFTRVRTSHFSIFGEAYADVIVKGDELEGHYFYLVAGHGGPDPGAQTRYQGYTLNEDEYAYDVTLRLARNLLEMGATVYLIVRDPDDGIRENMILRADTDEYFYPESEMKDTLRERLFQRSEAVNSLYDANFSVAKRQRAIMIHVDSRDYSATPEQIDVHFLYNPVSDEAKKVSQVLAATFAEKYAIHQPGRGYNGHISGRSDLHMLNQTKPVAVLIELGNIQHQLDRTRIMQHSNRQAVANWLAEGLLRESTQ